MDYTTQTRFHRPATWSLVALLLAGILAFVPAPAQAAAPSATVAIQAHWGRWGANHPMLGGFWITGTVTGVEGENVTVRLPDRDDARGLMRNVTIEVTLAVTTDSILLGNDLVAIETATLQEGDEVVIFPRLVWGNLTARMIFVGAPDDLADHLYRGRLVREVENTLTLDSRRGDDVDGVVDENTIWYDQGRVDRPAELPEDALLRVLGVEQEDGTVRAVLITSGARGY